MTINAEAKTFNVAAVSYLRLYLFLSSKLISLYTIVKVPWTSWAEIHCLNVTLQTFVATAPYVCQCPKALCYICFLYVQGTNKKATKKFRQLNHVLHPLYSCMKLSVFSKIYWTNSVLSFILLRIYFSPAFRIQEENVLPNLLLAFRNESYIQY